MPLTLPQASIAEKVLVMVPSTSFVQVPLNPVESSSKEMVTSEQLSEKTGRPVTSGETLLPQMSAVSPTGVTSVGAILSTTVIICIHVSTLPARSVTIWVLVMISVSPGHPAPPLSISEETIVKSPQNSMTTMPLLSSGGTSSIQAY